MVVRQNLTLVVEGGGPPTCSQKETSPATTRCSHISTGKRMTNLASLSAAQQLSRPLFLLEGMETFIMARAHRECLSMQFNFKLRLSMDRVDVIEGVGASCAS